jgi:hypothetical protein
MSVLAERARERGLRAIVLIAAPPIDRAETADLPASSGSPPTSADEMVLGVPASPRACVFSQGHG